MFLVDLCLLICCFFFFQAEDGIRDTSVTGVQTCALAIYDVVYTVQEAQKDKDIYTTNGTYAITAWLATKTVETIDANKIGRASCRERGKEPEGKGTVKRKRGKSGRQTHEEQKTDEQRR